MTYCVTFKVEGRYEVLVEADSIEEAKELGREEFIGCDLNEMIYVEGDPIIIEDDDDIVWEA